LPDFFEARQIDAVDAESDLDAVAGLAPMSPAL
jgi:hypothetical protein